MALHIKDNFQAGGPITQVPASWFNSVAGFINGLIAGPGIKKFEKTDNGATVIEREDGEKTSPDPTKGVSAHPDYYDYPDKQANPTDPAIVFPDWQRYYDMPNVYSEGELVAEHVPPTRLTGEDNVTPVGWERGKTAYKNGHNVGDASDLDPETGKPYEPVGLSMTVITHMRQMTVNGVAKYQAMFSRMEFDENGLLVRVVPCSNWYTMM